jgi:hypothetical protein
MQPPVYYAAPAPAGNPQVASAVSSIKEIFGIVRILAIIFGILLVLGGLVFAAFAFAAQAACTSAAGAVCSGLVWLLWEPILLVIFGLVDIFVYLQIKKIEVMVDQGQYPAAKEKTLLWMVLGFILGGVLLGILLLIAYLKFEEIESALRAPPMGQMVYGTPYMAAPQPAPSYAPPPTQSPPPEAAAPVSQPMPPPPAASGPTCPRCGKPATFVQQYNRYYCYGCGQYL